MIEFLEKTEQESRADKDRLDGIRKYKENRPDYRAPTIPEILTTYTAFKAEKIRIIGRRNAGHQLRVPFYHYVSLCNLLILVT